MVDNVDKDVQGVNGVLTRVPSSCPGLRLWGQLSLLDGGMGVSAVLMIKTVANVVWKLR